MIVKMWYADGYKYDMNVMISWYDFVTDEISENECTNTMEMYNCCNTETNDHQ